MARPAEHLALVKTALEGAADVDHRVLLALRIGLELRGRRAARAGDRIDLFGGQFLRQDTRLDPLDRGRVARILDFLHFISLFGCFGVGSPDHFDRQVEFEVRMLEAPLRAPSCLLKTGVRAFPPGP